MIDRRAQIEDPVTSELIGPSDPRYEQARQDLLTEQDYVNGRIGPDDPKYKDLLTRKYQRQAEPAADANGHSLGESQEAQEAFAQGLEEFERHERAHTYQSPPENAPTATVMQLPPPEPPQRPEPPSSSSAIAPHWDAMARHSDAGIPPSRFSGPKKSLTLEDVYARHSPDFRSGDWKLLVRRKEPSRFLGHSVAGLIATLSEPISTTQFGERFGGNKYEVILQGPPNLRTVEMVAVEIPGDPTLASLPSEERNMQQVPSYGLAFTPAAAEVETKKLEIAADERKRAEDRERDLQSRAFNATQTPSHVVDALRAQHDANVAAIREMSAQQLGELTKQLNDARTRLLEVEKELRSAHERLTESKAEIERARHTSETERTKELDARYTRELSELKDRHNRDVTDLKDRHAKELTTVVDRARDDLAREHRSAEEKLNAQQRDYSDKVNEHVKERGRIHEENTKERERLRDEAQRREQAAKDTAAIQMQAQKDSYEQRLRDMKDGHEKAINDLEKAHGREVQAVRDERDRSVAAAKSEANIRSDFSKETQGFRAEQVQNENARLHKEVDRLEKEVRDARGQLNKPLKEQLSEIRENAELLGLGPQGESDDGPFDWKKSAVDIVKGITQQVPEIAKAITGVRQQNAQRIAVQRQQVAQAQAQSVPQVTTTMTPPRPRRMAPPPGMVMAGQPQGPGWSNPLPPEPGAPVGIPPASIGAPPPPVPMGIPAPMSVISHDQVLAPAVAPANGTEVPFYNLPNPLEQQTPKPSQTAQAQPAFNGFSVPNNSLTAVPFGTVPQAQPQPQQQSQPQAQPQQPTPQAAGISSEQAESIAEFMGELDTAVRGGVVAPRQFAEAIIQRVGPQQTAQLLQSMPAEQFIAACMAHPQVQQTSLVTRAGQKFIRALWEEAASMLRQGVAA